MNDTDYFERLGLPRRFSFDAIEAERQYLARSRALHPDFHQLGASGDQSASLELTARLNEAYTVLRDPFQRAEYLLKLEGGPSASEQKEMPPEFLEEIMDLRMEMAELDAAGRAAMEEKLKARRESMLAEIASDFAQLESDRARMLVSIRKRLNALKYVRNLLRDL